MQLLGIEGHAIRGRVLLEAPSFYEWAGIHDSKLELVEWIGGHFFAAASGRLVALKRPTVAPAVGLLAEAVLKHACVGPNRRP